MAPAVIVSSVDTARTSFPCTGLPRVQRVDMETAAIINSCDVDTHPLSLASHACS